MVGPMRRFLYSLFVVPVLAFVLAPPALATQASFVSYGPGWARIYDPEGEGAPEARAGSILVDVDGVQVTAYCADVFVELDSTSPYNVEPLTNANGPKAVAVARDHEQLGTPLSDERDEQAAVQIAIWNILQGVPLTEQAIDVPEIRARAAALVAGASTSSVPQDVNPQLEVATSREGEEVTVTVTLTDAPSVEGQEVVVAHDGASQTVITDASGTAVLTFTDTQAVEGTVTAEVPIPGGVLLVPENGSQPLLAVTGFVSPTEAEFTVAASPQTPPTTEAPKPKPSPTPDTPPAPSPIAELPKTGGGTSLWLAVAGLALLGVAGSLGVRFALRR